MSVQIRFPETLYYWYSHLNADMNNRVATCQGKVREKQNFLQVRELSGNFEKNVREFCPFDQCQGIVREFCHDN